MRLHATPAGSTLDLVVSVFNEEEALRFFHAEAVRVAGLLTDDGVAVRILYVDDGSTDGSAAMLDRFAEDDGVEAIHLSRNFGHEAAMLAGLDRSTAHHVVFLDADLQHPPAEIRRALGRAAEGFDVVLMRREGNAHSGPLRRRANALFYHLLAAASPFPVEADVSDFFLINRAVADVLRQGFRERTRLLRGFVQWVGFRRATLSYTAAARIAGRSKYPAWRLVRLARDAAIAFSSAPLRGALVASSVMLLVSIAVAVLSIFGWLFGSPPSGYTTILLFMTFMAAAQFGLMAVQGEYLAQLVDEAKGRPLYLVARHVTGREAADATARQVA